MMFGLTLVFVTFIVLSALTALKTKQFQTRQTKEWLVDSAGLLVQGLLIPVIQTLLLARLWESAFPELKGALTLSPLVSFLASFVFIDYLYYWNHRLLHHPKLWDWHKLHHSTLKIDLFATSRNSLLTPALIIYVWANSLFLFFVGNSQAFLIASALGASLDLWRHSGFAVPKKSLAYRMLSPWLILPQDHEVHHEIQSKGLNFGANLKLWDQAHGTFHSGDQKAELNSARNELRDSSDLTWSNFVWPRLRRSKQ